MKGFTRKACLYLNTTEEKAISDLIGKIELLGASTLLTDCQSLLSQAKDKLSQWIDEQLKLNKS